ncbi:MAG: CidA/LrgA family protein [Bacilli bacterium]
MKIIKQIFIILIFYVLGEMLAWVFKLRIPSFHIHGMILGMLLFLAITLKVIKIKEISDGSGFLTNNMVFFFVPAMVSILRHFDILSENIWRIVLMISISSLLSFFAIIYSVKLTLLIQKKVQSKQSDSHD